MQITLKCYMIDQFIVYKPFEIFHWWRKHSEVTKMLIILVQFELFSYCCWFIRNVLFSFTTFHFWVVSSPWRYLVPIHLLIVCITFNGFLLCFNFIYFLLCFTWNLFFIITLTFILQFIFTFCRYWSWRYFTFLVLKAPT